MSSSRLFASIALLGVGVALWNGFVTQRKDDCVSVADAPPLGQAARPVATAPASPPLNPVRTISLAVEAPAATATPVSVAPIPSASFASPPVSLSVPAATAPLQGAPVAEPNALFSPAGSLVTERSQAVESIARPMPLRPLTEDASPASADPTAPSSVRSSSALARYRAKSQLAKRREKPAGQQPQNHRQAQSFEHPLGMR